MMHTCLPLLHHTWHPQVANACPEPVRVKLAYRLPEADEGEGCLIDKWFADERRSGRARQRRGHAVVRCLRSRWRRRWVRQRHTSAAPPSYLPPLPHCHPPRTARCVTDFQWLEPGEERWVAQAADPYFEWAAQLAGACAWLLLA